MLYRDSTFEEVKREATSIIPFWDFAILNDMTKTRTHFYDASHYSDTRVQCIFKEQPQWIEPMSVAHWCALSRVRLEEKMGRGSFILLGEGVETYRHNDAKALDVLLLTYVKHSLEYRP